MFFLLTGGPVLRMDPLNLLQIAVKNNIAVMYFSCKAPINVLFSGDGKMGMFVCVCMCV